ncbi:MAG TPA: hypothetical protein VFL79_10990 [Terriglobia bacterium]|nr:hypothetical protein [Terriglobia bacterium]
MAEIRHHYFKKETSRKLAERLTQTGQALLPKEGPIEELNQAVDELIDLLKGAQIEGVFRLSNQQL